VTACPDSEKPDAKEHRITNRMRAPFSDASKTATAGISTKRPEEPGRFCGRLEIAYRFPYFESCNRVDRNAVFYYSYTGISDREVSEEFKIVRALITDLL
jgi:hypothetical protein